MKTADLEPGKDYVVHERAWCSGTRWRFIGSETVDRRSYGHLRGSYKTTLAKMQPLADGGQEIEGRGPENLRPQVVSGPWEPYREQRDIERQRNAVRMKHTDEVYRRMEALGVGGLAGSYEERNAVEWEVLLTLAERGGGK